MIMSALVKIQFVVPGNRPVLRVESTESGLLETVPAGGARDVIDCPWALGWRTMSEYSSIPGRRENEPRKPATLISVTHKSTRTVRKHLIYSSIHSICLLPCDSSKRRVFSSENIESAVSMTTKNRSWLASAKRWFLNNG